MNKQIWLALCITSCFAAEEVPNEIPCLYNFFTIGDLVFDVGACAGWKTIHYIKHGARVVCVEPQPLCIKLLHMKFDKYKQVIIVEQAVGKEPSVKTLHICSQGRPLSTFSTEWLEKSRYKQRGYKWDTSVEVTLTTLDALIKEYGIPQYCKIDVENFEHDVLQGLTTPIPYLSFEFAVETFENTKKCISYLKTLGYQSFNVGIGEERQLALDEWVSSDKICEKIYSFLPRVAAQGELLWGDVYARYDT